MLTFFEYLRQRAFEAVLSGAEEALELLERKASFQAAPTSRTSASKSIGQGLLDRGRAEDTPAADVGQPADAQPANDGGEPLPAPRLRGRPRKKATRDQ